MSKTITLKISHCYLKASMATAFQDCLVDAAQILLDRLRNETTRVTAVKAFTKIAESPLDLDLSPVLEPLLSELVSYLRKANRQLRQASLVGLEVTVASQMSLTKHS